MTSNLVETKWPRMARNFLFCLAAYSVAVGVTVVVMICTGWIYGFFSAIGVVISTLVPCVWFLAVYTVTPSRLFLWRWFVSVPLMILAGIYIALDHGYVWIRLILNSPRSWAYLRRPLPA